MVRFNVILLSYYLCVFPQILNVGLNEPKGLFVDKKSPRDFNNLSDSEKHFVLYDMVEELKGMLTYEKEEKLSKSFVDKLNKTEKWLDGTENHRARSLSRGLHNFPVLFKYKIKVTEMLLHKQDDLNAILPPKLSSSDYNNLSVDSKRKLISNIAESSYCILMKNENLNNPEKDVQFIDRVISARAWLEQTNDPVAMILALELQHAVDDYLLNNLHNKELRRHKIPTAALLINSGNHIDKDTLKKLFDRNIINEKKCIDFALSFNTQIGEFCRKKGYSAEDFLNLRFFDEAKDKLKIEYKEANFIKEGNRAVEVKKRDIRAFGSIMWINYAELISTRKDAENLLLPFSLKVIDDARNARFIVGLYFDQDGFIEESEDIKYDIFNRKMFWRLVEKELSKSDEKRMTFPGDSVLWSSGPALKEHISYRIGEITDEGHPIGITSGVFMGLYNFIGDTSILFDSMKKENNPPGYPGWEVGKWLEAIE